jgi:hypothetical protein
MPRLRFGRGKHRAIARFSGAFLAPLITESGFGEPNRAQGRRSTEPKVSGSNPDGRAALPRVHAKEHLLEDGLTIVVAAPDDILRSKEAAGREKDRAALPQMRQDFREAGVLE